MHKHSHLIKFTLTSLIEFMILKMIKNHPYSAQEVRDKLKEVGMKVPLGTIYPIFKKIRTKGLISSGLEEFDNGTFQKTCCLTEKGHLHLTELLREWKHLNRFIAEL